MYPLALPQQNASLLPVVPTALFREGLSPAFVLMILCLESDTGTEKLRRGSSNMPDTDQNHERCIDEAIADSFPASDPPSFVGAGAAPGPPQTKRRKYRDFGQNFDAIHYLNARKGVFDSGQ